MRTIRILRLNSCQLWLGVSIALAILIWPESASVADDKPATTDRIKVEAIIRDLLKQNPEIIYEALRDYQLKQRKLAALAAQKEIAARQTELEADPTSPVSGNPNGDVVIVEFLDLRCPACKKTYPMVAALMQSDKGIRKIDKVWPILGPDSVYAARMALAARYQKKYHLFTDAMMAYRGNPGEPEIREIAERAGLDMKRAEIDMKRPEVSDILRRNFALAAALGLEGTPSYIIGGRLVKGGPPIETLRSMVTEARHDKATPRQR